MNIQNGANQKTNKHWMQGQLSKATIKVLNSVQQKLFEIS